MIFFAFVFSLQMNLHLHAQQSVSIRLPGLPKEVVVAGGSKYFAFVIDDPLICAVMEVSSGVIVKEIPLPSEKTLISGTRSELLLLDQSTNVLSSIELDTWKAKPLVSFSQEKSVVGIASGSFADGPVMFLAKTEPPRTELDYLMLRLNPVAPIELEKKKNRDRMFSNENWDQRKKLLAAGNGCFFDLRHGYESFQLLGGTFRLIRKNNNISGAIPDFSGSTFYCNNGRFYNRGDSANRIPTPPALLENIASWTPALDSEWSVIHRTSGGAELYPPGSDVPAFRIPKVSRCDDSFSDRRLYLLTSKSTLLETTLSAEVRLHRFNIQEPVLSGSYLHVTSTPYASVKAGERYEYEIEANSSSGGFDVSLAMGPPGTQVNSKRLRWEVPDDATNAVHQFVLQLTNEQGSVCFQSFRVNVNGRNLAHHESSPASAVALESAAQVRQPLERSNWSELLLPGIPNDMVAIGGSRYLAISYPDLPILDIVDVANKTARSIPLDFSAPFHLAGTAKKLLLFTNNGIVYEFPVDSFKRNKIKTIPQMSNITQVVAGSYGNGPIGVVAQYGNSFGLNLLDEESLNPLKNMPPLMRGGRMCVSPDGRLFCFPSNGKIKCYDIAHFEIPNETDASNYVADWRRPNFNGSLFYSKDSLQTRSGEAIKHFGKSATLHLQSLVPSRHGNLYLVLGKPPESNGDSYAEAALFTPGREEPIMSLKNLPRVSSEFFEFDRAEIAESSLRRQERVFLMPEYGTLAILPTGERRLFFRDYDLGESLREANMFLVDNVAPPNAYQDKTYTHSIVIGGANAPYELSLPSPMKGMKIDKNTLLWKVPKNFPVGVLTVWVQIESRANQKGLFPIPIQVNRNFSGETMQTVAAKVELREWKDVDGKALAVGSLVRIIDEKEIEILLSNRTLMRMPIADLCLEDIRFALEMDSQRKEVKAK